MAEHPILFTGPMVRAILDGSKSQTRRVIRPQPIGHGGPWSHELEPGDRYIETDGSVWKARESGGRNKRDAGELTPVQVFSPYGKPGDILWVREAWRVEGKHNDQQHPREIAANRAHFTVAYESDITWNKDIYGKLRPPIFMPRALARIFLRVKSVRVERVQEVTNRGALAEGVFPGCTQPDSGCHCNIEKFAVLWNSINAKRGFGWDKNPYVWVVEFEKES